MIGTLLLNQIEEMLSRHRAGRTACSSNDRSYVVPLTYAYDGSCIYAYSTLARKIEIMREQPLVCFEVDETIELSACRCVIAEDVYVEIYHEPERHSVIARLAGTGPDLVPLGISGNGLNQIIVFRIRFTEGSGRFERRDA